MDGNAVLSSGENGTMDHFTRGIVTAHGVDCNPNHPGFPAYKIFRELLKLRNCAVAAASRTAFVEAADDADLMWASW
jgi:hypothetical protein